MNKRKILICLMTILVVICLTGCGKKATLKVGKDTVVAVKGGKITANNLYNELKKDSIEKLVDMIDHKLLDKKYPTDDNETKSIDNQIDQIKSYYSGDNYEAALKTYFGVDGEKELRKQLSLEYKRGLAVNEYLENNIKDDEIQNYYDTNVFGDIKASHILIAVETTDDMSEDEKQKVKDKALAKAKSIIKQLDDGKSFASLVKKYSDDDATKDKKGDLGYFNSDDMDPSFFNAALKLEKNKYTETPVESSYGYHIILKTGEKKKKALSELKDTIKEKLAKEKLEENQSIYYDSLMAFREENKITFGDNELKKMYNDYMEELINNAKNNQNNSSNS